MAMESQRKGRPYLAGAPKAGTADKPAFGLGLERQLEKPAFFSFEVFRTRHPHIMVREH